MAGEGIEVKFEGVPSHDTELENLSDKANQVLLGRDEANRYQQFSTTRPDSDEMNPIVAEKLARDAEWASQAGTEEPQEVVKQREQERAVEVKKQERESKLFQLGAELDKWKAIAKRRKDDQTALEGRLRQLETRVNQAQPVMDVRQIT